MTTPPATANLRFFVLQMMRAGRLSPGPPKGARPPRPPGLNNKLQQRGAYSLPSTHRSNFGPDMNSSHFFQFSAFSLHAVKVSGSRVGGSKPNFATLPVSSPAEAVATTGAGGGAGEAVAILTTLENMNKLK